MKKLLTFCLALFLLTSAVGATNGTFPFKTSDWAREDVKKAIEMDILYRQLSTDDTSMPITRADFAANAASLVALEFGSNLESYLLIMSYRGQAESEEYYYMYPLDVARSLGILQGRGDGDEDTSAYITRQEAAVMLARTYRAYQGHPIEGTAEVSFIDRSDIADWALDDVRLMNQLGIMTGVGEGRFDPLGNYTIEQCLVSLVRLHEKAPYDGSKHDNPFAIPVLDEEFARNWFPEDKGYSASWVFATETEDYYIVCRASEALLANHWYRIDVIDRDLNCRTYRTPIITGSNYYRGETYAQPENAFLSEDGTRLIYTATVDSDVYYTDEEGKPAPTPVQLKGIYTVTMDLKTGEQTYTRADLNNS